MKVVRVDQNQDAFNSKETKVENDKLFFDRTIYKHLGSLTENKVITTPASADSEYDRFLLNMNKLYNGEPVDNDIIALDEYLGSLGITEEYPFDEDRFDIEQWLVIRYQYLMRNIVDRKTLKNVVDIATGYSVAHNTSKG